MPDYRYTTPRDGVSEAVPTEFDNEDTALIATNPDNRGPMVNELFEDVTTDKIEAFPEAAKMVEAAEIAAKWDVIGRCHDAMTEAGISLAQASVIMANVVAASGLISHSPPEHRGPNGTMRPRPHGDAPHSPMGLPVPRPFTEK